MPHWSDPSRWRELLTQGAEEDREELRLAIRDGALEDAAKAAESVDEWALIGNMDVYAARAIKRRFAAAIRSLKTNTNPKQEGK